MRAFVTGATGFIGAHLTRLLISENVTVGILKRPTSSAKRIADIIEHVTVIEGDLSDIPAAEQAIISFQPDVIFHLGWYGVATGKRADEQQISVNLWGSLELVNLSRRIGCKAFVGVGSQSEYGLLSNKISEDAPTHPIILYATVKLCTSLLAQQQLAETSTRFVWLRVFPVYGPGDHPKTFISYLIQTLLEGEKPQLTPGEQLWDYIFVQDVVQAIYRTAVTDGVQGVFNLGSGQVFKIRYIAECIRDIIDPNLQLGVGNLPYRPGQIMHLEADITRLTAATGWKPEIPLADGLAQTIESMKYDSGIIE